MSQRQWEGEDDNEVENSKKDLSNVAVRQWEWGQEEDEFCIFVCVCGLFTEEMY